MTRHFLILLLCASSAYCYAGKHAPSESPAREISIMTYNIKMLPRGGNSFLHHYPVIRAKLIPIKLISENTDLIVLEEAFDGLAIRQLKKGLKAIYPYIAGTANRRLVTYKRAGGVLIFSKYPLKEIESIRYSQCKGTDCMGNKGAMLVEVDHPVQKFQLLGTHVQAGGSVDLKNSQYVEAGDLLKRHRQAGMLQFIAGDFNTHKNDTVRYPRLLTALEARDGAIDGEAKVMADHNDNDMREKKGDPKKPKGVIDYIFIKDNGVRINSEYRYAREYRQSWSAKHQDLSDHFAVILKVGL